MNLAAMNLGGINYYRPGAEPDQFDEYGDAGQLAAETIRQIEIGLHAFGDNKDAANYQAPSQSKVSPPVSIESHVYPA